MQSASICAAVAPSDLVTDAPGFYAILPFTPIIGVLLFDGKLGPKLDIVTIIVIGMFVGLLSAVMGVGGGFLMVPAMIYLLRVPTTIVLGTSQFQTVFVASFSTILQAWQNQTVDAVLALLLVAGGVIGAQLGVRAGQRLKGEQLRIFLGAIVLLVGLRLALDLIFKPEELFSIAPVGGS